MSVLYAECRQAECRTVVYPKLPVFLYCRSFLLFDKKASLMGSMVLSFPLQLLFPALAFKFTSGRKGRSLQSSGDDRRFFPVWPPSKIKYYFTKKCNLRSAKKSKFKYWRRQKMNKISGSRNVLKNRPHQGVIQLFVCNLRTFVLSQSNLTLEQGGKACKEQPLQLITKISTLRTNKFYNIGGLYYKTSYGRNLRIFIISQSVCPRQAFPAQSNVSG